MNVGRPRPEARAWGWARAVALLLSVVTLVVTGYGWSVYRRLDSGLATSDVLSATPHPDGATDILLVGLDSRTDAQGNPMAVAFSFDFFVLNGDVTRNRVVDSTDFSTLAAN